MCCCRPRKTERLLGEEEDEYEIQRPNPQAQAGRRFQRDWVPRDVPYIDFHKLHYEFRNHLASWDKGQGRSMSVSIMKYKVVDKASFLKEIAVFQLVHHDNIIKLHGVAYDGIQVLLVFEYLPRSLKGVALGSVDEVVRVFSSLFAGLASLHDLKVWHRNIEPNSILLDDSNHPKISGFEFCRDATPLGMKTPSTVCRERNTVYLAPEILEGARSEPSQDVYAMGICLLHVLKDIASTSVAQQLLHLSSQCTQVEPHKRISSHDAAKFLTKLRTKGIGLYDKIVESRAQMTEQDCNFYFTVWGEYVKQEPQMATDLKALLTGLAQQFSAAPKQEVSTRLDYNGMVELANCHAKDFHSQLSQHVLECKGVYQMGPRKSEQAASLKVNSDYGGDYAQLLDFERGTGVFPDLNSLFQALLKLSQSSSLVLLRLKDRLFNPFPSGYRDILVNVRSTAFVGELQLTVTKLWDYKLVAHRALEIDRVLPKPDA